MSRQKDQQLLYAIKRIIKGVKWIMRVQKGIIINIIPALSVRADAKRRKYLFDLSIGQGCL
jgi:hypothetical protein